MKGILDIAVAAAALFLEAVQWMVIAHVVVSWVSALAGRYLYVRPLEVACRSLYALVRRVVPTQLGPVDFAPALVLLSAQALLFLLNSLA